MLSPSHGGHPASTHLICTPGSLLVPLQRLCQVEHQPLFFPYPATPRHLLVHEYQPTDAMLQESFCFFISLNQFKSALGPPPSRLEGNVISVIIGTPHFQGLCKGTQVLPRQQVGPSGHGLWCLLATAEMHGVSVQLGPSAPASIFRFQISPWNLRDRASST